MNNNAIDEIREAIHNDIAAIGGPLLTKVKSGTPAYRRQERRYNHLAGRLARARAEHSDAFADALDAVHPKVRRVIVMITSPKAS